MSENLQQLVNDLAGDLGVSLLVEDREHRVIAFSPQLTDIDEVRKDTILARNARFEVQTWLRNQGVHRARTPMRVPRNDDLNMLPRLCVPIWGSAAPLGYLWLITADLQREEDQLRAVERAGSAIAAAWPAGRPTSPEDPTANSRAYRVWCGDADDAEEALTQWRAESGMEPDAACVPLLLRVSGTSAAQQVQPALAATVRSGIPAAASTRALWTLRGHEALILLPQNVPAGGEIDVERLTHACEALAHESGAAAVRAGFGTAAVSEPEVRASIGQAASALAIAEACELRQPVVRWDDLGALRAAHDLLASGLRPDQLAPGFPNLLAADPDGILTHTLEWYLATGCSARDTAAALRIHRTSLYYRLDRATGALGLSASTGLPRLELHLALIMHRLSTRAGTAPAS